MEGKESRFEGPETTDHLSSPEIRGQQRQLNKVKPTTASSYPSQEKRDTQVRDHWTHISSFVFIISSVLTVVLYFSHLMKKRTVPMVDVKLKLGQCTTK